MLKPHPPWRRDSMRRGTDVAQSWMTLIAGLLAEPVWLDRHGALVRDPSTPADTMAMSVAAGTVAACGASLLVFGADRAGGYLLDRRRSAQWEQEWAALDAERRHHRQ
ncbi:hypothetical protein ACO0M4_31045 [Streptomyces sp. RGM 3693]